MSCFCLCIFSAEVVRVLSFRYQIKELMKQKYQEDICPLEGGRYLPVVFLGVQYTVIGFFEQNP